ncbi:MAG: ATP-binding protein [Synergistaceae bacterium]|nr:ATP-binding protein [Synergistaceae bacterium]
MPSVLFLYNAPADTIPVLMSNAVARGKSEDAYKIIHKVIAIAHENNYAYGNLWHNFLTHYIFSNENVFSLACERRDPPDGSLRELALHDFEIFMQLYRLVHESVAHVADFKGSKGEKSMICDWSYKLAASNTPEDFFEYVANFYKNYGIGIFAFNKAFRLGTSQLLPVANKNIGEVKLADIVGYEIQKRELRANTEAFLAGLPANNVLLYGDGGTGKSTTVKALLNEYSGDGLRVIEIYKHQFKEILKLTDTLRKRNYKFIIFIDDLSFEEDETDFKYLKAVIEGGIETRPDNVLIYATSNRRHLIREVWSDRDDMEHNGDIHRSDTVEEKLSLASRFGIAINYSSPTRKEYHDIVLSLAEKSGLSFDRDELLAGADRWDIKHGGMSGRAARQYIDYRLGIRNE